MYNCYICKKNSIYKYKKIKNYLRAKNPLFKNSLQSNFNIDKLLFFTNLELFVYLILYESKYSEAYILGIWPLITKLTFLHFFISSIGNDQLIFCFNSLFKIDGKESNLPIPLLFSEYLIIGKSINGINNKKRIFSFLKL
jgi:hypothetical protein